MYYFTQAAVNTKKRELKSLFPSLKFKVIKDGASAIIVEVKGANGSQIEAIYNNINKMICSPFNMIRHESTVIAL